MLKMFKHPSGNVAIAMLLMVVATMSGFTMSSLAMRDLVAFQYDFEGFQTMLLLRSEAYRGQKIAQGLGIVLTPVHTSERNIEITNTAMRKTFKIQSLLSQGSLQFMQEDVVQGDRRQMTRVESLVKTKAGTGQVAAMNNRFSLIRKYGIYTLESETFAKFMYFTDTDESPYGTPVYFYGYDTLYGRVHSNTDIWIQQVGGWPTFYGWVTTHGEIQSESGSYPEDDVFQGGLSEGYAYTIFPEEASSIRRRNNVVGPIYEDEDNIIFVTVDGTSFSTYLGRVQDPRREQAEVYNPYPPVNPDNYQYTNQYMVRDTVWSFYGTGSAVNTSKWVNSKLWLRGNFASYQTWGCADTMYLVGSVTLAGTNPGSSPISNKNDVVGLVSEKSIVIKYGYRDPVDSLRYHPNCGPDTGFGGIWIYAAMAALGDGGDNTIADGVFTFEYQHPHPSVPDVLDYPGGVPTMFTRIDLHRYHFPQTAAFPWARRNASAAVEKRIDFPWYNPLWPERTPYLERGYISVYGSISQRRRGFVHRSYLDDEWPVGGNTAGIWNQPIDYCGASSAPAIVGHTDPVLNIPLTTMNFPGTSGSGSGYDKNYHYDDRFYHTSPIDFPEVNRRDETPFAAVNWVIRRPPENL